MPVGLQRIVGGTNNKEGSGEVSTHLNKDRGPDVSRSPTVIVGEQNVEACSTRYESEERRRELPHVREKSAVVKCVQRGATRANRSEFKCYDALHLYSTRCGMSPSAGSGNSSGLPKTAGGSLTTGE